MVNYTVINSGSDGNATIINNSILIDCGVTYTVLQPYVKDIKLVFLTHTHTDHLNTSTISKLLFNRPSVLVVAPEWFREKLDKLGLRDKQVFYLPCLNRTFSTPIAKFEAFPLIHDVPNCGWKLLLPDGQKVLYATDTHNLFGVTAKNYDLYLVEANHLEEEIEEKIEAKRLAGEYCYETRARETHQSKERCDEWLRVNMDSKSEVKYMHIHKD